MKAVETNFLKFMQGQKQFVIPIYQRTYSWTLKQCAQLWKDIEAAARDDSVKGHFVGSVVYIEKGLYQVTAVPQLLVIDGQQRLTTMSLIVAALGRALDTADGMSEMTRKKLTNYYLVNDDEVGDKRYKLQLTRSDKDTLERILEDRPAPKLPSLRVQENLRFFEERIASCGLDPDTIYRGLLKLIIVDISLDRDHDNPQLIFESLNSTGLDLTQADLIRNYVLMGQEPGEQTRLYNDYWFPMEQAFGHSEYAALFDRFMRDYLTLKIGRIPNIYDVYAEFKVYVSAAGAADKPIEGVVKEVSHFSRHFTALAFARCDDPAVRGAISDINTLKVDVAYPFLLKVFEDHDQGVVTRAELLEILRLIESYVFRRAICGVPTNSLNKTFATLPSAVKNEAYLESLQSAFMRMDSYRRLPRDEEFRREFVVKDVYNLRARNYLLSKLENHGRKERVDISTYTIEHVMPQNPELSSEWRVALGDNWKQVQEQYLHTIGNLTLTGYNSELSDRPFEAKRTMVGGFADSPIRLNRSLARLATWGEHEIRRRAAELADLAVKVWPAPALSEEAVARYAVVNDVAASPTYTLDDHPHLRGDMLKLFEALVKRVLNIDASVRQDIKKNYVAFKAATNFVDVVPQHTRLRLTLNMSFEDMDDPQGIAEDVTGKGHWGNGDVEVPLADASDLDYVMTLIQQAFEIQSELIPS